MVQITLEKFQNKDSTLKTHEMFFVHNTPERFEKATITVFFIIIFVWRKRRQEKHMIILLSSF